MDHVAEMNKVLAEKKSRGMKGIRFFVEAESGVADFAHDFCKMEEAVEQNCVKTVYEPCS
jgi:hypothetical protein